MSDGRGTETGVGIVTSTIGDVGGFYADLAGRVARLGIDVASYPLSHVAYRCRSWPDYVARRDALEPVCRANVESIWHGRPISLLLLRSMLPLGGRPRVLLIELIAPPHDPRYVTGLEHLGFVVGPGMDAFHRRHRAVISGRQDQGPFNQPFYITLDDGRLIKFHERSLQEVAELEGHRFDGFYHAARA